MAVDLAVGLAVGLAVDLAVGLAVDLAVGLAVGLAVDLAVDLAVGLAVGLAVDLAVDRGHLESTDSHTELLEDVAIYNNSMYVVDSVNVLFILGIICIPSSTLKIIGSGLFVVH